MVLSIIIPVYNVEDYLRECIDSVITDSEYEYEIILVDDGSTDNSGMICDEYAEKYKFVQVIHQKNGGLAAARNVGLRKAAGKYISFIDSDDRIAKNSLAKVLTFLDDCSSELIFTRAVKFDENAIWDLGDEIDSSGLHNKSKLEAMSYLAKRPKYPGSACTKIFRKSFLKKSNIYFPEDRLYSEDLGFVINCIYFAQSYDAIDMDWYEYRQHRNGSITNKVSEKSLNGIIRFIDEGVRTYCINKKPTNEFARFLMPFFAYEYLVLAFLVSMYGENQNVKKETLLYLENNIWLIKYCNKKYSKCLWIFTETFGVNFMTRIIAIVKKMKISM